MLITLLNSSQVNGYEPLFGFLIPGFWAYMAFEAYHTAKLRQMGQPVDEFSSLVPGHGGSRFPVAPILLIALGVVFLLNNLEIFDATEPANLQGIRNLLVTGPNHPYAENFWKPGHIIGYEHTFIATLGDFLGALARNETFHPNFEDALAVQRVLDAVQRSADSKSWLTLEG